MDLEISHEWKTRQAERVLERLMAKMRNYRPVFHRARTYLEGAFTWNMVTGGGGVGGWKPEKPGGTWSSATGFPAILYRTGALAASLGNLRGAPNRIDAKEATFGTNVKYAKFHQYGTSEMPARPIVFKPVGFSEFMAENIAEYLDPGMSLSAFRVAVFPR